METVGRYTAQIAVANVPSLVGLDPPQTAKMCRIIPINLISNLGV